MAIQLMHFPNRHGGLPLRIAKGHFATSHSHFNYYVDLTMTKHRLSEAEAAAAELSDKFYTSTIIDTILCLDGTEVIGACMAEEFTRAGHTNMNAHQTIYVATPERTSGSQLIFRENIAPMIVGKHVLILAASITTGYTVQGALDAVRYYCGIPVGVCAIFSCVEKVEDFPVMSIYNTKNDLQDYQSTSSHDCPLCRAGVKLDALVNSHGITSF